MKHILRTSFFAPALVALAQAEASNATGGSNLFNFFDVSDLPDQLRKGLESQKTAAAEAWVRIFELGKANNAGPLSLAQITAVAHRLGDINIPTKATVRTYIAALVAAGIVARASKQTYILAAGYEGKVYEGPEEGDEDEAEAASTVAAQASVAPVAQADEAPAADEDDPLAD